eukprot:Skav234747  [mRNA]  locus=scaffold14:599816:600409:- [translate_table: standard]
MTQIRTLSFRNKALQGKFLPPTALDRLVHEQLTEQGWFFGSGRWQHEYLDYDFTIDELENDQVWSKVAHAFRQAYRWRTYTQLEWLDRREFREQEVSCFTESRLKLAKRWAQLCPGSYPVATGSVPSLRMREIVFGQRRACKLCNEPSPTWDHTWSCALQMELPRDLMLRRFGWPRHEGDFELCMRLLEGVEKIMAL